MKSNNEAVSSTELKELRDIRKHVHSIAEVSCKEANTSAFFIEELKKCNPDNIIDNLGGHGILVLFKGKKSEKKIMFRAELDALPISEINEFEYKSKNPEVSHKCGHDGHATTLLGFARFLSKNKPESSDVYLLFQPAEENGMGAAAILEDEKWDNLDLDYVAAFHNLPGYPLGQIVYKRNSFTASVKSVIFKLTGKTAHAAEPEFGINPAFTLSKILNEADKLSNNDPEREDFVVITPVYMTLGDFSYGIAAGYGELHLTIRTWSASEMEKLEEKVVNIAKKACESAEIDLEIGWTQVFKANQNDDTVVNAIIEAAKENEFDCHERSYPFKWGEDFGLFTQKYKGAMFGIGAGEDTPALHNPDYDFPDEIIPVGINMFKAILEKIQ
ncbi:MAG: amidohydrolase [Saprospiraceae bacterium]